MDFKLQDQEQLDALEVETSRLRRRHRAVGTLDQEQLDALEVETGSVARRGVVGSGLDQWQLDAMQIETRDHEFGLDGGVMSSDTSVTVGVVLGLCVGFGFGWFTHGDRHEPDVRERAAEKLYATEALTLIAREHFQKVGVDHWYEMKIECTPTGPEVGQCSAMVPGAGMVTLHCKEEGLSCQQ